MKLVEKPLDRIVCFWYITCMEARSRQTGLAAISRDKRFQAAGVPGQWARLAGTPRPRPSRLVRVRVRLATRKNPATRVPQRGRGVVWMWTVAVRRWPGSFSLKSWGLGVVSYLSLCSPLTSALAYSLLFSLLYLRDTGYFAGWRAARSNGLQSV